MAARFFPKKCLLALVDKGIPRDTAYRMVQRHALKVGREGGDLKEELIQDPEIRRYPAGTRNRESLGCEASPDKH